MTNHMMYFLSFLVVIALCTGCSLSTADTPRLTPADVVHPASAIPEDVSELEAELKNVRARERLLTGALDDARTSAAQNKLWLGSGGCFLAALVLVGIGIWTSRRILIEIGIAAAGLGGLLIFAAWLAPYALPIGITVAISVIGVAVWMLVNREKALGQVTHAVDAIKPLLPNYADSFRQHIDSSADRLIDHVRKNRK